LILSLNIKSLDSSRARRVKIRSEAFAGSSARACACGGVSRGIGSLPLGADGGEDSGKAGALPADDGAVVLLALAAAAAPFGGGALRVKIDNGDFGDTALYFRPRSFRRHSAEHSLLNALSP
jgi:hypothetical protein